MEKVSRNKMIKNKYSSRSLILGIISLVAWIISIVGFPIALLSIMFGLKGLKNPKHLRSYVGISLAIIGGILSVTNFIFGMYIIFSKTTNTRGYRYPFENLYCIGMNPAEEQICKCITAGIEKNYSYNEFMQIAIKSTFSGKWPEQTNDIAQKCKE